MLSTRLILTLLPAFLTLTSASSNHRRADTYDELTTTSTEVVYVTVTQTRTTDGTPYTALVTPTPSTTTTSCTTSTTSTTTTSCTTTDIEVPYPEPTTSTVVYHPYGNDTVKHTYAPSSGYTSTVRLNMTTYATVMPTGPPTQEGAAGRVGAKGVVVAAMGVVGAVVALL